MKSENQNASSKNANGLMFKNALISVSDKNGLLDFVRPYAEKGMRIVSTGGTAKYLKVAGFKVIDISEQTGFPEVMDGRVKTLHPNVHMALLGRVADAEHMATLNKYKLEPFDLVIGNLYPFEEAKKKGASGSELIEFIDIGGPSFLRSAAKNFETVAVVCDPADYQWIQSKGELTQLDRQNLAAKVFAHVSSYDAMIAASLNPEFGLYHGIGGVKVQDLRYGENPQQSAAWYRLRGSMSGLHDAKILQGKTLSYNNLLDLHAAFNLVSQFESPAAVAVKHNNPCGVAHGSTIFEATEKCLKADPVSVFGGIIALNRILDEVSAEKLSSLFLECIIAPGVTEGAKSFLAKKKNVRVLEWADMLKHKDSFELKTIAGGYLVQQVDQYENWDSSWKVIGTAPTEEMKSELLFAWKVCASLKSNAIAITAQGSTLGLGMGQVNRVEAVGHAIERMNKHHSGIKNCVLASDAFFPFPDSIELIAKAGIKWIIQPGGSVNDEAVFEEAKKQNINMVITGKRHFRH